MRGGAEVGALGNHRVVAEHDGGLAVEFHAWADAGKVAHAQVPRRVDAHGAVEEALPDVRAEGPQEPPPTAGGEEGKERGVERAPERQAQTAGLGLAIAGEVNHGPPP